MRLKTYIFDIRPKPAPRMTKADIWKKRPSVIHYRDFRDGVAEQAEAQKFPDPPPHKFYSIVFVLAPKKSRERIYQREKEMYGPLGNFHQSTPDLDNVLKALMDSLYHNDKEVCYIGRLGKLWGDQDKIIITVDLDNMYHGHLNRDSISRNELKDDCPHLVEILKW